MSITIFHKDLVTADLHVPGYLQDTDPGAVGAGKYWIDSSAGVGLWILKVRNTTNTSWEVLSGNFSFLSLSDTPSSYSGQGLKALRVNLAENAIEFYTVTSTDSLLLDQNTPQSVINGSPKFQEGITIKTGKRLYLDGS